MNNILIMAFLFTACIHTDRSANAPFFEGKNPPHDTLFVKGDRILKAIFKSIGISDSAYIFTVGYDFSKTDRVKIQQQAKEAFYYFNKSLNACTKDSPEYIECLVKLAISSHFQIRDFSYSDSLPSLYHQSMGYMDKAITAQLKLPLSSKSAQLCERAATLAIPHFYWNFQSPVSALAETKAYTYLEQAGEIYSKLKDNKSTLRIRRLLPKKTVQSYLEEIALAKNVEGANSIALADDIQKLFHFAVYNNLTKEEMVIANEYADLGISIYMKKYSDNEIYLLRDVGYYYKKQLQNLPKALNYYLQSQKLEERHNKSLYYNAFFIAAIYIELDSLQLAKEQYSKALKEKLSPTDNELAYFGLAMVEQIGGQKEEAVNIWKNNIVDTGIMNGVSAFQSYFSPEKKNKIKEQALELINVVGATNAKRIVENDWMK